MAFGFSPKHQQTGLIEGLSHEQLLALSAESIKALKWQISFISPTSIVAYTSNSMFTANQEITVKVVDNHIDFKSVSTGTELFDLGKNENNSKFFFSKIKDLKEKINTDELDSFYETLKANISLDENDERNQSKPSQDKITGFFSIFIPKEGFFITPILIDLNIIVFILMLINGAGFIIPENQVLLNWGANFRPLTIDGEQWWRLFTSTFIHGGFIHLLMNLYALLYIGILLEPYLGKLRFAVLYILTGLAASTTSLCWHDFIVCVGASGAIFGLYGIFLAMLTTNLIEKTARKAFLTSIGIFVVYNLLNGMKGNIDNAAHIGGLLAGVVLGYGSFFTLKSIDNLKLKLTTLVISIVITIAVISIVFDQFPKNYAIYDSKMNEFARIEAQALEFYTNQNTDLNLALNQIVVGLDKWEKCNAIFDSVDKLDLPIELRVKTDKLREYVKLRIESYEIIRGGILKDSLDEELLLVKVNQIDSVINYLKNN